EYISIFNLNSELTNIEITSAKVEKILESEILELTISDKFVGIEDLVIPSIVVHEVETLRNEEKEQIGKEELKAFFNALLATSGTIHANSFELNHINLPTTKEDADIMTGSLIVAATLSSKIMTNSSAVCVIDEKKVSYTYQSLTSEDQYIEQEELSSLLLALTVGVGLNDPTNLSFNEIAIPTTDEKKQALTNSEIIRATISQKVLNQDAVSIDKYSSNLDISRHYNRNSVGILSKTEILNIIKGLELLNPTNGSFDNLVLDVREILMMPNKETVLRAISESDVYLYIISKTLGEDQGYGFKSYQIFTTTESTAIIDGIDYIYQPSLYPGRYTINYPSTPKEVYSSFNLTEASAYICESIDILALQNTMQSTY
ncbi:MAG: hypothetical protein K2J93_01965, partial [Anaeroplasmataceae bacterium]|nr:hypothetical protein [Anaeroplasmataceae bacterium]